MERLLTEREAAERLRLSVRTLQKWRWSGFGPQFKTLGRSVRYSVEDLENLATSSTRSCTATARRARSIPAGTCRLNTCPARSGRWRAPSGVPSRVGRELLDHGAPEGHRHAACVRLVCWFIEHAPNDAENAVERFVHVSRWDAAEAPASAALLPTSLRAGRVMVDIIDAVLEDVRGARLDTTGRASVQRVQPRRTRAEMARDTIRFLCPGARFLPRGVATLMTSAGGVGKSRFFLQLADALSTAAAPFGCEHLRPERPQIVVYIGAEDRASFFHSLLTPLLSTDEAVLAFDVVLLPEVRPGFTLSPANSTELSRFLHAHRDERPQARRLRVAILPPIELSIRKFAARVRSVTLKVTSTRRVLRATRNEQDLTPFDSGAGLRRIWTCEWQAIVARRNRAA
jgi:hypothetical protein